MTDLESWVTARVAGAPESLRARVRHAAAAASTESGVSVAGDVVLRRAADAMAADSLREETAGAAALLLLTADALVTLACHWAAETDPDRLGTIA